MVLLYHLLSLNHKHTFFRPKNIRYSTGSRSNHIRSVEVWCILDVQKNAIEKLGKKKRSCNCGWRTETDSSSPFFSWLAFSQQLFLLEVCFLLSNGYSCTRVVRYLALEDLEVVFNRVRRIETGDDADGGNDADDLLVQLEKHQSLKRLCAECVEILAAY